jgi:hypothetical protein
MAERFVLNVTSIDDDDFREKVAFEVLEALTAIFVPDAVLAWILIAVIASFCDMIAIIVLKWAANDKEKGEEEEKEEEEVTALSGESSREVEAVEGPATDQLCRLISRDDCDSEVEIVGFANEQIYAHPRAHCPIHRFEIRDHRMHCEKCYCIKCHTFIPLCSSWERHCHLKHRIRRKRIAARGRDTAI